jgi:hypothetical protein
MSKLDMTQEINEPCTAHSLARALLSLPDLPVIGREVGQGGNERGDEPLTSIAIGGQERDDILAHIYPANPSTIELFFG